MRRLLRSNGRIVAVVCFVTIIWLLAYTLEPRRTAYSCRTVGSCLGLTGRHYYRYALPVQRDLLQSEETLRDGTTKYRRQIDGAEPEVLFLILSKDAASWSSDFRSGQRTPYDLMDLLVSTGLNLTSVSVAMMTSSPDDFATLKEATGTLPFARTTLLLRPDNKKSFDYGDRHKPSFQFARRCVLATLRNYLMMSAVADERHIVWLDADVVELSKGIVQTMIQHSETSSDAGIITAMCHQNQMVNYDKNAWKVNASQLLGIVADEHRQSAVKDLRETWLMVPELIDGTDDSSLVALDSVGGTILYIRSELVRQGLVFPYANMVGTTWSQQGWVGVETEGICYMARSLEGGGCFVLGGSHHVRHSDWG